MTLFEVWAPHARKQVDVEIGGERTPLQRREGGWWSADLPEAGAGTDYAFRLDGGDARPDPRSRWQPHGVHGPSRVVDDTSFEWHDAGWRGVPLEGSVVY